MDHQSTGGSALLLDRLTGELRLPPVDLTAAEAPPIQDDRIEPGPPRPPVGRTSPFQSPGLAMLAVTLVLEGYRWLGVIPTDDSRLSSLLLGRAGMVVFAALFVVAALALTRPVPGANRPSTQKLVVASAGAVVAASCVSVASSGPVAATVLGVVDLVAAGSVAAAFAVNEWGGRRNVDRRSERTLRAT